MQKWFLFVSCTGNNELKDTNDFNRLCNISGEAAVDYKMTWSVPVDKGVLDGACAHRQVNRGDIWVVGDD